MSTTRVLAVVLVFAVGACRAPEPEVYVPDPADRRVGPTAADLERPRVVVERGNYPDGETPRTERELLVLADGSRLRHGREAGWYPNGQLEYERFFEHDEPTGTWRTWFSDGAPRSETPTGEGAEGQASWWYEDGTLSSRGPVHDGRKHGEWTHYYDDGSVEARGEYRLGRKHGLWTYWAESGEVTARGEYERGVRVGEWELRASDGDLRVRGADDGAP